MLVSIESSQSLTRDLAHAIETIGTDGVVHSDSIVAPIETNNVMTAGKDNSPNSMAPCALKNVIGAHDVVWEHVLPRAILQIAAKVEDQVRPAHGRVQCVDVAEFSLAKLF
jgi:hypothetical protein